MAHKKWLLLVLGGLLLIGVLFFVHPVNASITYVPASNYILTSTNDTTSLNGSWTRSLYDADKAGILNITTKTVTGNDTSLVSLDYSFRPADYYVLGGSSNDFWVNVTAFSGFTNCTICVNGTNYSGVNQSELFTFNGTGGQQVTKMFRTVSGTRFRKWGGAGSVTYRVTQGQWGVISKDMYKGNSYSFNRTTIRLAAKTHVAETNTSFNFVLQSSGVYAFQYSRYCSIDFGVRDVNGTGKWGCSVTVFSTSYLSSSGVFYVVGLAPYYLNLSGCRMSVIGSKYSWWFSGSNCDFRYTDTLFYHCYISAGRYGNITRCTFMDGTTGLGGFVRLYTSEGLRVVGINNYAISLTTNINMRLTLCNASIINCPGGLVYCASNTQGNHYFRNLDVDPYSNWNHCWGTSGTGKIYRQYGFKPRVVDGSMNNLSGVTIKIYQQKNYTGSFVLDGSYTTDSSGMIGYKWVNRSKYWYPGVDRDGLWGPPNENYTIRYVVNKAGYQTVNITKVFTEEDKSFIQLKLNASLTQYTNQVNCTIIHTSFWNGSGFLDWANGTGNSSGGDVIVSGATIIIEEKNMMIGLCFIFFLCGTLILRSAAKIYLKKR